MDWQTSGSVRGGIELEISTLFVVPSVVDDAKEVLAVDGAVDDDWSVLSQAPSLDIDMPTAAAKHSLS